MWSRIVVLIITIYLTNGQIIKADKIKYHVDRTGISIEFKMGKRHHIIPLNLVEKIEGEKEKPSWMW